MVLAQSSTSLRGALSRSSSPESPSECTKCNTKRRPYAGKLRSTGLQYQYLRARTRLPTARILPHGSCAPPPSSDQLGALAKDVRLPAPCDQKLTTHGRPPLRTEARRCEVRWSYMCECAGGLRCRDDAESGTGSAVLQIRLQIGLAIRRFVMQLLVCHQLSHCCGSVAAVTRNLMAFVRALVLR
jgi:hypothetical protein